jgi:hypothetical protein
MSTKERIMIEIPVRKYKGKYVLSEKDLPAGVTIKIVTKSRAITPLGDKFRKFWISFNSWANVGSPSWGKQKKWVEAEVAARFGITLPSDFWKKFNKWYNDNGEPGWDSQRAYLKKQILKIIINP